MERRTSGEAVSFLMKQRLSSKLDRNINIPAFLAKPVTSVNVKMREIN